MHSTRSNTLVHRLRAWSPPFIGLVVGAMLTCALICRWLERCGTIAAHEGLGAEQGSRQQLSVEETLGLVFVAPFASGLRGKLFARANPDVREAVRRVLDDEELHRFHDPSWRVLCRIGDQADVKRVERAIEQLKSTPRLLTSTEEELLRTLFNCLGIMCARDLEGACALARKIQDPGYWRNAKWPRQRKQGSQRLNVEYKTLVYVMYGYSLSLRSDLTKRGRLIVESTDDAQYREVLKEALSPRLLWEHGRNSRAHDQEAITPAERDFLLRNFNGDLDNPGPAAHLVEAEEELPDTNDPRARQLRDLAQDFQLGADGEITHLTLVGDTVSDAELELLDSVPNLTTLSLGSTAVTDDGLKHLAKLKRLERLTISRSETIGDAGLRHIAPLTTLTSLNLAYLPNIGDEGLQHLQSLKNLETLGLSTAGLTVECLKHVRAIKGLKGLHANFHSPSENVAY